jgi:hypothetical protein
VLRESVSEKKTNLGKGKGHVNLGANSQDCEIQGSNLI